MPGLPEPEQVHEAQGRDPSSQDVSLRGGAECHGGEDADAAGKRGIQVTAANRGARHRGHKRESRIAGVSCQRNSRSTDRVQLDMCGKESEENLVMSPE